MIEEKNKNLNKDPSKFLSRTRVTELRLLLLQVLRFTKIM